LEKFSSLSLEDHLKKLKVSLDNGLSKKEALQRLKKYGPNALKIKKSTSTLRILLSQFNNPLIFMLIFAAFLSLILYDKTDALIIFGIILISTLLSFFQERSATLSMEKLLSLVQIKVNVIRDGQEAEIPIEKVVPGDIVLLSAGDVIPGDCFLIESKDLFVDEASLTGESLYSEKEVGSVNDSEPLSKKTNVLFMGTHVVSGTAKAIVVLTGNETEFGKISHRLNILPPETEFESGVRHFGYMLMQITSLFLFIIFIFNIYLERPLIESLLFALSLSVGLTPQLLPAIITINLSHGARKMAEKHVIVKKLTSIENFGSMNILCADKTGTLTTGEIKLDKVIDIDGKESQEISLYATLNAALQTSYTNPIDKAIIEKFGKEVKEWKRLDEAPYDFERKRMSVLVENGKKMIITKGAFHAVLEVCHNQKQEIEKKFSEFSKEGYRVLGLACKETTQSKMDPKDETGMTFLGFLLFLDPIKKDSLKSLEELKKLGIQLKILTGDNELVALHVAKTLGISEEGILTGKQLHQLSDHALYHQVVKKSIFAEIEPNQKERIILALRKTGHVVGFLGDGINDVTALHTADVSITVDSASDAAKEISNIVLMKKDLTILKEGVLAGRKTFANTLKYIFMASSANFGNMFSMAGISLFLPFLPLLPKQVLLTNLLTDFPEMAIATDHVDQELLQKPLRWDIKFVRKFMMIFGIISSFFDYMTFGVLLYLKAGPEQFRTTWFIESVISATLIVLVVRTFRPFYKSYPSKYLLGAVLAIVTLTLFLPQLPFSHWLGFTPIPLFYYGIIAAIVAFYILAVEIGKSLFLKSR
jgi:Mg2+-importing ATPase